MKFCNLSGEDGVVCFKLGRACCRFFVKILDWLFKISKYRF